MLKALQFEIHVLYSFSQFLFFFFLVAILHVQTKKICKINRKKFFFSFSSALSVNATWLQVNALLFQYVPLQLWSLHTNTFWGMKKPIYLQLLCAHICPLHPPPASLYPTFFGSYPCFNPLWQPLKNVLVYNVLEFNFLNENHRLECANVN